MHGKIYNNITELIGRTPLVRLNRIVPAGAAEVVAKRYMQKLTEISPGDERRKLPTKIASSSSQ